MTTSVSSPVVRTAWRTARGSPTTYGGRGHDARRPHRACQRRPLGTAGRDILATLTDDDVTDGGFGFLTCREIQVQGAAPTAVLASRISYVGELGWELYVPMAQAAAAVEALLDAGEHHGAVPVGIGVYGTTGRLEKGYRAFGYELDAERTIVEAGMQRPKVKAADFVGKEAYLAQRERSRRRAVHAHRRRPHLGAAASSGTCSAASRS